MYLTAKEAGEYVREHPANIRTKATKGIIRGFKRGGTWLFLQEDLDHYIQRNENTPRQEVQRHEELKTCQNNQLKYINVGTRGTTRSVSQMVPDEYAKAVGLVTSQRR